MAEPDPDFEELLDAMKKAAGALREAEVPFVLGGGLACWARGAPKTEHDVDFLVRPEDAAHAHRGVAICQGVFHSARGARNRPWLAVLITRPPRRSGSQGVARLTRRRTDASRPRGAWPSRTEANNRSSTWSARAQPARVHR